VSEPAEVTAPVGPSGGGLRDTLTFRFLAAYAESKVATVAFVLIVIVLLMAVFAPVVTPQNPYDLRQLNIADSKLPPGETSMLDGYTYVLGTDDQGRDLYSGIVYGLRISLSVGILSTVVALLIGTAIGLVSAYFGGWVDSVIMRIVDIQLSFPAILIALILLAILGKGVDKVILALIIVQWAYYARTARSTALVERRKEYIEAAHCLALGSPRVVFRHLLPNCLPPVMVVGTVQMAHAVTLEATLSFLGVGVPITEPSLGLLISNGFEYMMSGLYWISFYPGVALFVIVASINLIGDQLRDVLNPRLER
jgi:peptide/nickel transport system permease protein